MKALKTYHIGRWACLPIFLTITVISYAQPGGDLCSNADTLMVSTSAQTDVTMDLSTASETAISSCEAINTNYPDVWYTFTVTFDGNVRIFNTNGNNSFTFYDSCGGTELRCFFGGNGYLYNVSSGSTFRLKVARRDALISGSGTYPFSIQGYEASGNDECSDPIQLTVSTVSDTTIQFNLHGATESLDASCQAIGNINHDIWYALTAPVTGNISILGSNGNINYTLYDSCGSTELRCFFGNGFFYQVNGGASYILRASARSSLAGNQFQFRIQGHAAVPNDECADAIPLVINNSTLVDVNLEPSGASETVNAACEGAGNFNHDAWYTLTAPVTGNILVTGASGNTNFALYDSCGGTEIRCFFGNGFFYNVTGGTPYVLRVSVRDVFAVNTANFSIRGVDDTSNDECENAIAIAVSDTAYTTVPFEPIGASENLNASCETTGNQNHDVWFTFTAPVTGNIHIVQAAALNTFSLFDTCGGVQGRCFTGNGFFYTVQEGIHYTLRVATRAAFAQTSYTFDIQGFLRVPNDSCNQAIAIPVSTDSAFMVELDQRGASEVADASCDVPNLFNHGMWYTFTAPVDGNIQISNSDALRSYALHSACGNEIGCFNGNNFFFSVTGGTEYWLRAGSRDDFATGLVDFSIQAHPHPVNDTCSGALPINIAILEACSAQNVFVDNRGAIDEGGFPSCDVIPVNMDVWYTFEPLVEGDVILNTSTTISKFALYDGCGGTELDCFIGRDTMKNLLAGQTYYLRAWRDNSFAGEYTFCLEQLYDISTDGSCSVSGPIEISAANSNNTVMVPFLDGSSELIAAINANGNDLGNVTVSMYLDSAATRDYNGNPYLKRAVEIQSEFTPVTPVTVRLDLLEAELDSLVNVDASLFGIGGLQVLRSDADCALPFPGIGEFILCNGTAYGPDSYVLQFDTDSFSTFYPTSTDFTILPIELMAFSGEYRDEQVELKWSTASELNGSHFEVYRSDDGEYFEQIGSVAAKGESTEVVEYGFIDFNATPGLNYYQLKQVDQTGEFEWSKVVVVDVPREKSGFRVYPNPTGGEVFVELPEGLEKEFVQVYGMNGRLVEQMDLGGGVSRLTLPKEKGVYVVKVGVMVEKVVVW